MPIASMTGFSRETGVSGSYQWVWELKSVNGRGLELRFRTPPGYELLGEEARKRVQSTLVRGQCQINLSINRAATASPVHINVELLQTLIKDLGQLQLPDNIQKPSLDGLLSVRGVVEFEDVQSPGDEQELQSDLRAGLDRLIVSLVNSRQVEGKALLTILSRHLDTMSQLVNQAETAPGRHPQAIKERLKAQIEKLLGEKSEFDENRLYQEALIMAVKADIQEELDRLKAHIDASRELLMAGGPVGRKLDFLAQEFGREVNTLCAKAIDITLSRIGLELKAVIEQFREQVQNVE